MNKYGPQGVLLIIAAFLLASCMGFKNTATRGGGSSYITFYVNDSTEQFFIKPLAFKNSKNLKVDFTFRKIHTDFSEVTMNFSVISPQPASIDSVKLLNSGNARKTSIRKLIYKEKHNGDYKYRYGATIPYSALKAFITGENPKILLNTHRLTPTRSTSQSITKLKNDFFGFVLKASQNAN